MSKNRRYHIPFIFSLGSSLFSILHRLECFCVYVYLHVWYSIITSTVCLSSDCWISFTILFNFCLNRLHVCNQLCITMDICKPFTYSSSLRRVKCSSVVLVHLSSSRVHCWGTSLVQLWQCSFYFLQQLHHSLQSVCVHLSPPSHCSHWCTWSNVVHYSLLSVVHQWWGHA